MPAKMGDFLLVEYAMYARNGGEKLVDTNIKEEAEKSGAVEEGREYTPSLVILGEGFFNKNVEEGIVGMEEGAWKTITLPPEKAFGKRDPSKVRVLPARELSRRGIIPRVNEEIEIDGRRGVVRAVGGGRVIVDFNHPLAGKEIVYKIHLVKIVESLEEKLAYLVRRWFKNIEVDASHVTISDGCAVLLMPIDVLYMDNLPIRVRGLIRDVEEHLKEISGVKLVFEFEIKREEEKKEEAAEAKSEAQEEGGKEPQQEQGQAPEGT